MAKKTKKHPGKRRVHHKRKMSGINSGADLVMFGLGLLGGGIASAFVVQGADTAFGKNVPLAVNRAGVTLAGAATAYFGRKYPIAIGAGAGITAVAGTMLVNELGLNVPGIAGLQAVGAHRRRAMNGGAMKSVGAGEMNTGFRRSRLTSVGALYSN